MPESHNRFVLAVTALALAATAARPAVGLTRPITGVPFAAPLDSAILKSYK